MATPSAEVGDWRELPLFLWLSPAFPVGSFAYSHGLEWAVEAGDVVDAGSLGNWLADLADLTIYVIDVAGGEKIQRKGGPGVTRSDLLVINKIDLAPHVGASLEIMARDAALMRKTRPFVMANMKTGEGVEAVIAFLRDKGRLGAE